MLHHFKLVVVLAGLLFLGSAGISGAPQDDPVPVSPPAEKAEAALPTNPPAEAGHKPKYKGPSDYLVAFEIDLSHSMFDHLRALAVGRLFVEEPELKELAGLVEKRYDEKMTLLGEMTELASDLGGETDLEDQIAAWARRNITLDCEIDCLRAYFYKVDGDDEEEPGGQPAVLLCASLSDKGLESLAKPLDELREIFDGADDLDSVEITPECAAVESLTIYDDNGTKFWFFQEGNEIYCGINDADLVNKLEEGSDEALDRAVSKVHGTGAPLLTCTFQFDRAMELILEEKSDEEKPKIEKTLEILGLANIPSLVAGLSVEGDNVRETFFVEKKDEPSGILACFRAIPAGADGGPPPFAPIDPNLMTIRGCLDVEAFLTMVQALIDHRIETEEESGTEETADSTDRVESSPAAEEIKKLLLAEGAKAFDGGYVFTLASPKRGGMVPRFAFGFGVGDKEKFDAILSLAQKALEGIIFEESEYKGVKFTMVKIPNNPAPLVPCYAQVGRAFYIAETPWTMKGIIASFEEDGADAAQTDGAEKKPLPARLPLACDAVVAELDYDVGEIFRLLYDQYMPMIQVGLQSALMRGDSDRDPILDLAELPMSEVFLRHLTAGRGGAGFVQDGFCMSAASPIGDPLVAATMITAVPLGLVGTSRQFDEELARAEQKVCELRVKRIAEALKVYRTSFGGGKRFPPNLGELVTRGLIEDFDLFLVPSDEEPAVVEFMNEDGEIETMEVSYKYLPDSKFVVPKEELERPSFPFLDVDEMDELVEYEVAELPLLLGDGSQETADEEKKTRTIILYELNKNSHGGRILLCADGTIHHVSEHRFKAIIGMK